MTNRDRVITELRLRLPATEDRDKIIAQATATAAATPRGEDFEGKQAMRVAQSTVGSLQVRFLSSGYPLHMENRENGQK